MLESYLDTQDSVRKQMETFSVPTQWMDATRQMEVPVFNPFAAFQPGTGTASEKPAAREETRNPEEVEELSRFMHLCAVLGAVLPRDLPAGLC